MIKTFERGHYNANTVSYYDIHAVPTLYKSPVVKFVLNIQYKIRHML